MQWSTVIIGSSDLNTVQHAAEVAAWCRTEAPLCDVLGNAFFLYSTQHS